MLIAVHKSMEHAATVTYAGTTGTLILFGMHASDLFMGLSCIASLVGVGLQVYVALAKVSLMKHSQRWAEKIKRESETPK